MRVTREKAAEHRAAIVTAAAELFRERGFDRVNVAEIMKAAGLTHGGFYGHFASKDALAAEACGQSFADAATRLRGRTDIATHLESYLSESNRDRTGCPMAAYVSDIARQDAAVQESFAHGVDTYLGALSDQLEAACTLNRTADERRERSIFLLSAVVGALALSRATQSGAPDLSREILDAVRDQLHAFPGQVVNEPATN
jgi:TetR/AcrR family transcriptional repressor of nem operon